MILARAIAGADAAGPRGASRGAVFGVSLALGPGLHAVLGAPEDGTIALGELLAGRRAPARGTVLWDGRAPHRDPALRRRIAHLAQVPDLPEAWRVGGSVTEALAARGVADPSRAAAAALAALGVGGLAARRLASLTHGEARAVDAAIALAAEDPVLVVAHEPFADLTGPGEEVVERRLRALATAGACVIVLTSSPRDASRLGDEVLVLERGLVVRGAAAGGAGLLEPPPWPGASPLRAELVAQLAPPADASLASGARAVAKLLADRTAIASVTWDEAHESGRASSILRVAGPDEAACAMALLEAVEEAGAELVALAPAAATLLEVRTATAQMRVAAAWYARAHAMPGAEATVLRPPSGAPFGAPPAVTSSSVPHASPAAADWPPGAAPQALPASAAPTSTPPSGAVPSSTPSSGVVVPGSSPVGAAESSPVDAAESSPEPDPTSTRPTPSEGS